MPQPDPLTERFIDQRCRLRALAYRLLGSISDADDALQDAWLRVHRTDPASVQNPDGWLTTVVARVCLNHLRSRAQRREDPLDLRLPDPVIDDGGSIDPERQAMVADAVGLALQVVIGTLSPDERLSFVLHDLFAVSFDEIAPLVERSPAAARQLASRARRRVRDRAPAPDTNLAGQRRVVDAFFAAARNGDFEGIVAVLHPDAVFRAEGLTGGGGFVLSGARTVAGQAALFGPTSPTVRPVLVNGAAGVVVVEAGRLLSVAGFSVVAGRIRSIDVLADPARLASLQRDLSATGPTPDGAGRPGATTESAE
jgi:RNA polymerase sigma factor (sigma-70 family)